MKEKNRVAGNLFTVFSQLNTPAFISNLAWWTRRLFESAIYLDLPFSKKELLFVFLGSCVF